MKDIESTSSRLSQKDTTWKEQKTRVDDMLAKLKEEMKEVKSIDKDLTRQFIILGGKINEIKNQQSFDDDDGDTLHNCSKDSIMEDDIEHEDTKL